MYKRKKSIFKRLNENRYFQKISTVLYPIIFGVIVLVLWQTEILHKMIGTDVFTLPLPTRIIAIINENQGKMLQNVTATLIVTICGLVAGSIIGYLIALLATSFSKWKGSLTLVAAFNAVPIVALAPVVANWTKDVSKDPNIRSMVAKILVVMIVCIATMSINAFRGLNELKPSSKDLLKSYAAKKGQIFFKLQLPNSVPYIFTALRVSVPLSVISAIVSEYFTEYIIGVGRQIRENIVIAQYPTAWAYIVVACLIGIMCYGILLIFEGIMLKHQR